MGTNSQSIRTKQLSILLAVEIASQLIEAFPSVESEEPLSQIDINQLWRANETHHLTTLTS